LDGLAPSPARSRFLEIVAAVLAGGAGFPWRSGRAASVRFLPAAPATDWVWLSAILAVGLLLRVIHLGRESLWLDEATSWRFAQLPLHTPWLEVLDTNPPLYYSLQRLWLVFGDSEAALRSLSAIFGVIAIALIYVLGRQVAGARTGLFAAALMATSALQIEYSQEARAYELLTAAAVMASIGLVGVLRATRAGTWPSSIVCCAYVGGMLIALYAHNIAPLLFAVAGLIGLADLARRRSLRCAATWGALNGLVVIGWGYWMGVVWHQATHYTPSITWIQPPDVAAIAFALNRLYGEGYVNFVNSLWGLIGIVLAFVGAFLQRGKGLAIAYLIAAAFGIPLAEIAISHLGRPVFLLRTVIWLAPLFFVLVAAAFSRLRPGLAIGAIGLLLVIQLIGVRSYEQTTRKPPWREAIERVSANACPGDVMILAPYHSTYGPFSYYMRQHDAQARVIAAYDGLKQTPGRGMQPFGVTNLGSRNESLLSEPRVWLFLDESFASDATAFVMRLQAQHAILENWVITWFGPVIVGSLQPLRRPIVNMIGRISVRLFALPGASCPPRH
jgi:mannosyltransferase